MSIQRSIATMSNATEMNSLRRERSSLMDQLTFVSRLLDEYKRSGHQNKALILFYRKRFDEPWSRVNDVQYKLESLDENENAHLNAIFECCHAMNARLMRLERNLSSTGASKTMTNPKSPECSSNMSSMRPAVRRLHAS
jgi:hypothetical protein